MTRPTARAVSCLRLARLALHLAHGLWIVQTRYARLAPGAQDRTLERWSRGLLSILRVRVKAHNAPVLLPDRCLLVANHSRGWTSSRSTPCSRPLRRQVRGPAVAARGLAGRACRDALHRARQPAPRRSINGRVVAALANGRLVSVFPEGTTTDGSHCQVSTRRCSSRRSTPARRSAGRASLSRPRGGTPRPRLTRQCRWGIR